MTRCDRLPPSSYGRSSWKCPNCGEEFRVCNGGRYSAEHWVPAKKMGGGDICEYHYKETADETR